MVRAGLFLNLAGSAVLFVFAWWLIPQIIP